MADAMRIGLIGCGVVGTGTARLLLEQSERLTRRAGRPLELVRVVVRDRDKHREGVPTHYFTTDMNAVLNDPTIEVVVELIGGMTTAKMIVLQALEAGKHVVTANKALLAHHGLELFSAARRARATICFEAAVAGGVPIIRALAESLSANQVVAIQGILNGTSNYILSAMTDQGLTYQAALKEAQRLGYAEADPTLDVDGSDAAHKLAILAQIAFGVTAKPEEISKQGVDQVEAIDIRFARELGYTIKLLAEAWTDGHNVALHVAPVLLQEKDMLAQVRSAFNAIQVVGDVVGETLYQGAGAGMMATASSVVADLVDLAIGRAQLTFAAAKLWSQAERGGYMVAPNDKVRSRFYLRLMLADQPGVLAEVCRVLAEQTISISSLIQHEPWESGREALPLVIMTHPTETGRFRAAVEQLNRLPSQIQSCVHYSVDD